MNIQLYRCDIDSVGIEYIHKRNNNARGRFLQYKNEYKKMEI